MYFLFQDVTRQFAVDKCNVRILEFAKKKENDFLLFSIAILHMTM